MITTAPQSSTFEVPARAWALVIDAESCWNSANQNLSYRGAETLGHGVTVDGKAWTVHQKADSSGLKLVCRPDGFDANDFSNAVELDISWDQINAPITITQEPQ